MQFDVRLFVREHYHGYFSIEVLGESALLLYTDDLDRAREELTLVLGDRFERMHPGLLGEYAAADSLEHRMVDVPDGLVVDGEDGPAPRPIAVSVLLATDKRWLRLHLPRWSLRAWIDRKRDPEEAAIELLTEHLGKVDESLRLQRRPEAKEWLETLSIEADPPAPIAFTGPRSHLDLLPEPRPEKQKKKADDPDRDPDDEDDDEDEDEAAAATRATRRKPKRVPTPTLDDIGVKLHRQAADGELERAHGRDKAVDELFALLADAGATVALVGERGVGKTTVLNELVHRLRSRDLPKKKRRRVYYVDASRLIAGEGFFGDWQRQCLDVVQECIDAEVVWYIGGLHDLLDAGKSAHSDQNLAQLLRPYLSGRRLRVVAEATTAEWARVELRDAGFARLWSPYRLDEPDRVGLRGILDAVAAELVDETGIPIPPEGRQAIEDLTARFRSEGSRLGQSVHFLRRLVDDAVLAYEQALDASEGDPPEPRPLGRAAVVDQFCAETGLPPFLVRDDQPLDPEAVRRHFRARIIGQSEAVDRMTDLVALMKAGLSDLDRPMGSFLFVGPTGVGKTEMSKALAEFLFGRRDRLIRFDMSEFARADSVHRFIGDAGEEGQLIAHIRRQPFSVVLLDEIEKAHPAVFDVLLQVLGEARLSDQAGRTADFRNAVVLLTSNLGVETFKRGAGFGAPSAGDFREHFLAEAERFFRPEFFNRIDHIVPFMPLEADAIDAITGRETEKFLGREGITQRDLHVELGPGVHRWLADRGVEPRYGARPLKRLIEQQLTAPLARHLAGRQLGPGYGVRVDAPAAGAADVLGFTAIEHRGVKGRAAARGEMRGFIMEVAAVRWQVQQWLGAAPYREMVHAVRLLDRLARDRNFWADRERAERRMRRSQRDRDLIEAFSGIREQLAGVEDLAYEAFHDRTAESLPMLRAEQADGIEALDEAELTLMGRTFDAPDRAMLYLRGGASALPWLRRLVKIYAAMAEEAGWTLTSRLAVESDEAARARKAREAQGQQGDEAGEDGEAQTGRRKRRREKVEADPAHWSWRPPTRYRPKVKDDPELGETPTAREKARRRALQTFVDQTLTGKPENIRCLVFEGPDVAALLGREDGLHQWRPASESGAYDVRVRAVPGARHPVNPAVIMKQFSDEKCRVLDDRRRTLTDERLELVMATEPRLHRLYRRCQRLRIYDAIFGAGAWRLFERRAPDRRATERSATEHKAGA